MTACALHPGTLITTDIGRNSKVVGALMKLVSPFTKNPSQGAATTVYATVHEPAADVAGAIPAGLPRRRRAAPKSNDPAVAQRLWNAATSG